MKVVSYYNVVPKKNKSQEKFDILTKFIQGVNAAGDDGIVHQGYNLIDCDVGVIQGWQHQHGKSAQHLMLRQNVIDLQKRKNKTICTADSNLFLYANKSNEPHHYLRYSFNGVFPNTGVYFDNNPDPKRWQQISSDLNISLEPKKHKGKNILICLQRDGGWSMGKRNVVDWTVDTISKIRKHSDRTIVIRPHPKDNKAIDTYLPSLKKFYNNNSSIEFSNQDTQLDEDLNKTWAVVNHNSSSIVGPIIQGYHAFITDATTSQCAEVAHTDFSLIDSPLDFDRQQWVERISMFHWKFSELEDGSAWRHMRQYV
jgi:hypothetical protein